MGETWIFEFQAKMPSVGGVTPPTTALAFIKTLDPDAGYAQTNFVTVDMSSIPGDWNGYSVYLTIDEGLHMEYHVDPATHRIRSVMMIMEGPPHMIFQADYADFRLVDGILFPHTEETWAGGTMTSFARIQSITINPGGLEARVAEPTETTMDGMI